ncbi:MAG: DUF721 domain-containing protein [Rhodobacteraceae bacterium]|nr:DUF721 domain-containing protein [Paracoccaceae bacterium]
MAAPSEGKRRAKGFEAASGLLKNRVRSAGESRGFAVSRLLTHWPEVVGEDIAAMALPVKIVYGHGGFGATLTVLTTGAMAPLLQMKLPGIKDRVNACYGYNAISRIAITQTAPTGFAEGQVAFGPAPKAATPPPDPGIQAAARTLSGEINDPTLRAALEALGEKVLSRSGTKKG